MSYDQTSNRITNSNYEFDQAGNQTRGQAPNGQFQRFDFDAAGRLVKIKDDNGNVIESYTYGASRQRLKTVNGSLATYYAWGGSSVLCEYTETTGNPATFKFSKSYIYAGSRLLSTQTSNGTAEITEFHHPDRLGTKLVTNDTANTSYEQSTLPFGTALNAESTGFSNQVFTSYERSAGTGLDYTQNRFYNSGQGRFTNVDPIGMSSGSISNPQSNNLFAYTQNNPIDFTDPSGLFHSEPKPQQPDWGALWNLIFGHEQMHVISDPDTGGGGPAIVAVKTALTQSDACRAIFNQKVMGMTGLALFQAVFEQGKLFSKTFGAAKFEVKWEGFTNPNETGSTRSKGQDIWFEGRGNPQRDWRMTNPKDLTWTDKVVKYEIRGATVTIANNVSSLTQAESILHELGHVADLLFGVNASTIQHDEEGSPGYNAKLKYSPKMENANHNALKKCLKDVNAILTSL